MNRNNAGLDNATLVAAHQVNAQPRPLDSPAPVIRHLGRVDYQVAWRRMQQFTDTRTAHCADELWFLEHPPVFTLGMAGRSEHLLAPGDIPVMRTDRGGQVTYHGPGQLVVYALIDLRRAGLGVRDLVTALENCVIRYVAGLVLPQLPGGKPRASMWKGASWRAWNPHPPWCELSRAGAQCEHGP